MKGKNQEGAAVLLRTIWCSSERGMSRQMEPQRLGVAGETAMVLVFGVREKVLHQALAHRIAEVTIGSAAGSNLAWALEGVSASVAGLIAEVTSENSVTSNASVQASSGMRLLIGILVISVSPS